MNYIILLLLMQFTPIRNEREVGALPLSSFLIAITTYPNIQKILDTIQPIKMHLKHLKGIKILKQTEYDHFMDVPITMDNMVAMIICTRAKEQEAKILLKDIDIVDYGFINLPTLSPMSRIQYEQCAKLWPCQFKDNRDKLYELTPEVETIFTLRIEEMNYNHSTALIFANDSTIYLRSSIRHEAIEETVLTPSNSIFSHCVFDLLNKLAEDEIQCGTADRYLATNLDCILLFDPCLMCGMALLHSRINRLFVYPIYRNCGMESAFSDFHLHSQQNLNHRFVVYNVRAK